MTTQLFWVPNHALGGWLTIGLLARDRRVPVRRGAADRHRRRRPLVAAHGARNRSVRTAEGVFADMRRERSWHLLNPGVWAPRRSSASSSPGYLTLDPGAIPRVVAVEPDRTSITDVLRRSCNSFSSRPGLIGVADTGALRRSADLVLALALPRGPAVRRISGPATIWRCAHRFRPDGLAIRAPVSRMFAPPAVRDTPARSSCSSPCSRPRLRDCGAEFSRALILPAWPINLPSTLIDADLRSIPATLRRAHRWGCDQPVSAGRRELPGAPSRYIVCESGDSLMVRKHLF